MSRSLLVMLLISFNPTQIFAGIDQELEAFLPEHGEVGMQESGTGFRVFFLEENFRQKVVRKILLKAIKGIERGAIKDNVKKSERASRFYTRRNRGNQNNANRFENFKRNLFQNVFKNNLLKVYTRGIERYLIPFDTNEPANEGIRDALIIVRDIVALFSSPLTSSNWEELSQELATRRDQVESDLVRAGNLVRNSKIFILADSRGGVELGESSPFPFADPETRNVSFRTRGRTFGFLAERAGLATYQIDFLPAGGGAPLTCGLECVRFLFKKSRFIIEFAEPVDLEGVDISAITWDPRGIINRGGTVVVYQIQD